MCFCLFVGGGHPKGRSEAEEARSALTSDGEQATRVASELDTTLSGYFLLATDWKQAEI